MSGHTRASSPLISLVLTVWNPRRDHLLEAVASALGQRHCRFELVVVDDGSDEPVEDQLRHIEDPRMRIVRVPHGGLSQVRNEGTAAARGDRVRFIDGDDLIEPESTARLSRLMGECNEQVFTYGASLHCDEDLRPIWKMASRRQGSVAVDSLLGRFSVRPHTLLFSRRVLEATGDWDVTLPAAEDWDFITRAAEHARVRGETRVATFYRRHGGSFTGNVAMDFERAEQTARRVVERYFDRHPDQRGTSLERLAEARIEAIAARRYATHGRPRDALRHAGRAIARDPRALTTELALALPAVWGQLRYGRVTGRSRPVTLARLGVAPV
jgi:glycosyltransferase involved in cell wall biosynthesis